MSEPTRYALRPIFLDYTQTRVLGKEQLDACGEHAPYPHKEGNWIKWEDYARLKAEVERLTKAGDDFSYAMDSLALFANEEARLMARTASLAFKDARNAAKEGKPIVGLINKNNLEYMEKRKSHTDWVEGKDFTK